MDTIVSRQSQDVGNQRGENPIAGKNTSEVVEEVPSGYSLRNRVIQGPDVVPAIAKNNNNQSTSSNMTVPRIQVMGINGNGAEGPNPRIPYPYMVNLATAAGLATKIPMFRGRDSDTTDDWLYRFIAVARINGWDNNDTWLLHFRYT
jgi:hypothetical protein